MIRKTVYFLIALTLSLTAAAPVRAGEAQAENTGYGIRRDAEMRHGDEHFIRGEYPAALAAYGRAKSLAPSDPSVRYRMALTAYVWGDAVPERREDLWARARSEANGSIDLNPLDVSARTLRMLLLYRTGNVTAAKSELATIVGRVRQGDPELWLDLASAALATGDGATAAAATQRAREILGDRPNARADRIGAKIAPLLAPAPMPAPAARGR